MKKSLFLLSFVTLSLSNNMFAQSTSPLPYCDASFDDMQGFPVDDQIKSVTFGTLSNITNSQFAAPHYVFYNNLATQDFVKGNPYNLELKFDVRGGCGYAVWIDYNNNNTFEANEKIAGTTGTTIMDLGTDVTINKSITIPTTAQTGRLRMRVRIVEDDNYIMNSTDILPCNASASNMDVMDWGETEDYEINVINSGSGTGINDIEKSKLVNITPNPSTGKFSIEAPEGINEVQIIDITGSIVFKKSVSNQKEISINENLTSGNYFIKLISNHSILTKKIQIIK